jgi:hypothetical protein
MSRFCWRLADQLRLPESIAKMICLRAAEDHHLVPIEGAPLRKVASNAPSAPAVRLCFPQGAATTFATVRELPTPFPFAWKTSSVHT